MPWPEVSPQDGPTVYVFVAFVLAAICVAIGLTLLLSRIAFDLEVGMIGLLSGIAWMQSAVLSMKAAGQVRGGGPDAATIARSSNVWNLVAAALTAALAIATTLGQLTSDWKV